LRTKYAEAEHCGRGPIWTTLALSFRGLARRVKLRSGRALSNVYCFRHTAVEVFCPAEARKETIMGLLDVLHGMQNGPRGSREPEATSGGMSKMAMALIALLGYKALKSYTGTQPTPAPGGNPGVNPTEATSANASSGGLMGGLTDLLKGPLGGILAGASAGSVVNGGLSDLLDQFRKAGHGEAAGSWVGNGPNRPVPPADLSKVLGADQINTMMSHSGLSRDELLAGLSDQLPRLVDRLTPNGRMPTDEEMSRIV
jgi:uncharacterized protein YidB (DUF937 family)